MSQHWCLLVLFGILDFLFDHLHHGFDEDITLRVYMDGCILLKLVSVCKASKQLETELRTIIKHDCIRDSMITEDIFLVLDYNFITLACHSSDGKKRERSHSQQEYNVET